MIREALEFLTGLGREAAQLQIVDIDRNTKLIRNGSTVEEREVSPRVFKHQFTTLRSLVEFYGVSELDLSPVICIEENAVSLILDSSRNDDRVVVELPLSKQMLALSTLERGIGQRDLVKQLRTTFAGYVEERFLAIVRRLDFQIRGNSNRSVGHASDTLGKAVKAVVQSKEGEIPETIVVDIPWFATQEPELSTFRVPIRLAVDVDLVNEKFSFGYVGDDLERGKTAAKLFIESYVKKLFTEFEYEPCPVYFGRFIS